MGSELGAGQQKRGRLSFPTPIPAPDPHPFQLNFTGLIVLRDPQQGFSLVEAEGFQISHLPTPLPVIPSNC